MLLTFRNKRSFAYEQGKVYNTLIFGILSKSYRMNLAEIILVFEKGYIQ